MRFLASASALAYLGLFSGPAVAEEPKPPAVAEKTAPVGAKPAPVDAKAGTVGAGRKVSIEYTLVLDDGKRVDSNVGGEPLVFEHGKHEILPALEEALSGMKESESRKVTLAPEQAYGKVMPELIQEVDPKQIPEDARVAGTELAAEDPEGNRHFARVHEVRDDKILVDMNHPLAGQTLHFDVKVLKID